MVVREEETKIKEVTFYTMAARYMEYVTRRAPLWRNVTITLCHDARTVDLVRATLCPFSATCNFIATL